MPPAQKPPATTTPPAAPVTTQTPSSPAATPGPGPTISGRPPELPLRRYEPRIWEAKLEANIYLAPLLRGETAPIQLRSVVAWVPMIAQSTFSVVDPASVKAQLFVQGQPARNMNDRVAWVQQLPFGMAAIGIGVGDVSGQSLRWNVSWKVQVWNSRLDETAAAAITWPQEWPAEVRHALEPQPGIESDAPEFKRFVERTSEGKLRQVTPYIAAKELVRATVRSFRTVDMTGLRQENGFTRGLMLQGAYAAMQNAGGSVHDMTAACVAVLRAAGIPARVVVGMSDLPGGSSGQTRTRLLTWAELYLPTAGWVPFDPAKLRGSGNALPAPDRPWPNFGNWDDLNQRVPLSYTWSTPAPGASSLPYPAVWGWSGSGYTVEGITQDSIGLQIVNRGRGQE